MKYTDNIFYYIYHITNHLSIFVNYFYNFISYGIIIQQVSLLIRLICPKNLCINPTLIFLLINRWLDKIWAFCKQRYKNLRGISSNFKKINCLINFLFLYENPTQIKILYLPISETEKSKKKSQVGNPLYLESFNMFQEYFI